MKTYRKILGILSGLIVLSVIVLLVGEIDEYFSWLHFFLLLIPLYIVIHYLISTKFGFESRNNSDSSFFKIVSIISIIIFILIPLSMFYFQKKTERHENAKLEILKQPKTYKTDSTVYDITCNLKTRYEDKKIDYVFQAIYGSPNKLPNITGFIVHLQDSSGFEVFEMVITDWTNSYDAKRNELIGIHKAGKISFPNSNDYSRISSFKAAIRHSQ
jgi:hypothetical protein